MTLYLAHLPVGCAPTCSALPLNDDFTSMELSYWQRKEFPKLHTAALWSNTDLCWEFRIVFRGYSAIIRNTTRIPTVKMTHTIFRKISSAIFNDVILSTKAI